MMFRWISSVPRRDPDGEALYVVDGHAAGVLLIAARDDTGAGLYRVAGDAPGPPWTGRWGRPPAAQAIPGSPRWWSGCTARAYTHITADSIRVLGGIGFTWEHPAHLYFRQARSSAVLFGTEPQHRATLADRLGL
jgi:hypothetical protein